MRTEKRLWRRNAGNLLEQTVGGATTTFRYDGANQLLSRTSGNGFTVDCAYDAAGRLVKEGDRSFSYGWMDKVLSVTDGDGVRTYSYGLDGQLASATDTDGAVSEFLWDGLALIRRGGVDYLNEPHPNGGSPILASDGRAFFNDILGTSQGTLNGREYRASSLTAFGDGADGVFFTGKPKVDNALGYAFLFRNYRPDNGKWLSADPLGYPDGWNNLAYCNNCLFAFDPQGLSENWIDYLGAIFTSVFCAELYGPAIGAAWSLANGKDVSNGQWDYAGFTHWLCGGGETVHLPWNCFDNGTAYMDLLNQVKLGIDYISIAENLYVGQSITIEIAPCQYQAQENEEGLLSSNAWISYYTMYLESGTATISRTSQTEGSITINAYLKCYDIADFNPGGTFGKFWHDSWFIPFKRAGAMDYVEYAFDHKSCTSDFHLE